MSPTKTRFAPSPTGLLHLGNARTALFSALLGERFLLRIEDTDQERSRAEYVAALIRDLHWLGVTWDEGPADATPVVAHFQSQRGAIYHDYYQRLERDGLAYPCFCSPTELEISRKSQIAAGRPPRYSGKCANLDAASIERRRAEGREPTLRFRVPAGEVVGFDDLVRGPQRFQADDIGDFIIRRADGSAAFFFCNAIDDALMGVTHVLRGEDHLTNTPRQMLILKAVELPIPTYAHVSLILGDDGAPLSKRNGSRNLAELREQGYLPIALLNMLSRVGHHYESEELLPFAELKARFDPSHLGKSPARFDLTHLNHWQTLAVHAADDAALTAWLRPETLAAVPDAARPDFLAIVRSNCTFPDQADRWAKVLFGDELSLEAEAEGHLASAGAGYFSAAVESARAAGDSYEAFLGALKTATGAKGKALFMPLRAALTGRLDGPELTTIYRLLGPARAAQRLAQASR